MPKYWEKFSENRVKIDDSDEKIAKKELNMRICAEKYPYFFQYRYLSMKTDYDEYKKTADSKSLGLFGKTVRELKRSVERTEDEQMFLDNYDKYCPMDESRGVQNRICWAVEDDIDEYKTRKISGISCKTLLDESNINYDFLDVIKNMCDEFTAESNKQVTKYFTTDQADEVTKSVSELLSLYVDEMYKVCSDESELCDILIELCYNQGYNKEILWRACESVLISRLLSISGEYVTYPQITQDIQVEPQFVCKGRRYTIETIEGGSLDE